MKHKSFFEYLGLSDVERIHSQFFAWLFSSDCLAISQDSKHMLLAELFKTGSESKILKVLTEFRGIDILIETSKEVIVIENKLKSSQHSNQLHRYKAICDEQYPITPKRYYFLTLTGEKTNDENWNRMSYHQMYTQLMKLSFHHGKDHTVIVKEYLVFLRRLTSCVQDFLERPQQYDMVFMDGKKKKVDKVDFAYATPNERFIASNQLETILQKCFLHCLSERINTHVAFISDTRGDALIDFPIKGGIEYKGRSYSTILQLQNNTIKFAFAVFGPEYGKSEKVWIEEVIPLMKELSEQNEFNYMKMNKPTSRAYVSVSKTLKDKYWKMETAQLVSFINGEIANAEVMTRQLIGRLESI